MTLEQQTSHLINLVRQFVANKKQECKCTSGMTCWICLFKFNLDHIDAKHAESGCKCQSCKNSDAKPLHTCPYKEDINDDRVSLCDCCDSCRQNCLYDI